MDILNTKIKNIKTEKALKVRPENIKSGVSIFGINGSVTELNGETATVTPTTSSQTITPTGIGKNALTSVTVNAVTNSIDNNITAGNIKNGVTILGVQGNYEGIDTSDANATANDIVTNKTAYVNGVKITGQFNGVDTSDATAIASDIALGKTAYVNGQLVTGTLRPYIELEYIQSSGTQYLAIDYALNSNVGLEIDYFKVGSTNSYELLMGNAGDNRFQLFYSWETGSNKLEAQFGSSKYSINANYNLKHSLVVNKNGTYTLDGNTATFQSILNTDNSPFYIFAGKRAADSAAITFGKYRLYKFKLYENETLLYDLVPALRLSDNEVCMFDRVSNTFYTNQGSGDFTAGSIVQ